MLAAVVQVGDGDGVAPRRRPRSADTRLVARCRRLPGLRPQLRRRERRRDRRPRRRPRAAPVPARPRGRRPLVQPVVPVAARRHRLRHRRLPRDRSGIRDARGGRAADRRGTRARHPHDRRHRPEPRLEPAPVVPARRSRLGPGSPERERFWFRPGTGADGELPPNGWQSIFGGSAWTDGVDGRRVVPAPVRARAARPQLDASGRLARARRRPALLVRPRRRGRAHRLGGAARQGPGARRGAGQTPAGRAPVQDRDELHDIYRALARDRRRLRRAARARRRDLAARRRAARAVPAARRAAHGVQLRLPRVPVGARPPAHLDRVGARSRTLRWTRRRRGCSRTTT